jgi:hypothetical protein
MRHGEFSVVRDFINYSLFARFMKHDYERLMQSDVFALQKPTLRLVNAFIMESEQYEPFWQFGFFDDETEQIHAFVVKEHSIEVLDQSDAMKEPESYLPSLDLDLVMIGKAQAQVIALELLHEQYNLPLGNVKIFLLANDVHYGVIWNITFVTATFDVVNVKVNAITGEIVFHKKHSLLDLNAKHI